MRVTDRLLQNGYLANLNNNKVSMTKTQEQLTTQSKVNKPSDSPLSTNRLLRLNSQASDISTYIDNIESSFGFIDATVNALDGVQNNVQRVMVDLTTINNAAIDSELSTFADQLQVYLDSMFEYSNSEFNGKYLFGGTDSSQAPYTKAGSPVTYTQSTADTSGVAKIKISDNISQKINITGNEVFGAIDGTDIFNRVQDIIDDLRNGIKPSDADVTAIESFNAKVIDRMSAAGNLRNRLENTKDLLDQQELNVQKLISSEKDVDMAKAIIDYENQQFNLDLTYKVSSMILPKSLLDYL